MPTKTILVFLASVFFTPVCTVAETNQKIHETIRHRTDEIFTDIVEIRRDIHQYPDLSGREKRTSDRVATHLKSMGLEVITRIGGHGVLGVLKGASPGPVVGWRADMDALAWSGQEDGAFASKIPGIRHVCGHDVHTAIALGIAEVLSSIRDKLPGSVAFIFQPSEENFQGARAMINDGLFERVKPDVLFALHIAPISYDRVAVKANEMFAYRGVALRVKLKPSQEAEAGPEEVIEFLKNLSTLTPAEMMAVPLAGDNGGILSPDCKIREYLVINDKSLKTSKSGRSHVVEAEVYSSSLNRIQRAIDDIKTSAWNHRIEEVTHSVRFWQRPVINDPVHTERATAIISSVYGSGSVLPLYGVTPMFNDDFAQFQERIPGVYFFLGGSNPEKGIVSMPHSPGFAVDEECIRTGINYFSSLIFEEMARKK